MKGIPKTLKPAKMTIIAQHLASGKTVEQSCKLAGYSQSWIDKAGYGVVRSAEFRPYLDEARQRVGDGIAGLTREWLANEFRKIADTTTCKSVKLKALNEIRKTLGLDESTITVKSHGPLIVVQAEAEPEPNAEV